jgi:hypothetical protein
MKPLSGETAISARATGVRSSQRFHFLKFAGNLDEIIKVAGKLEPKFFEILLLKKCTSSSIVAGTIGREVGIPVKFKRSVR